MQLRTEIFLVVAFCLCPLSAGQWTLDGENFAFDSMKGRARAVGPVRFEMGDWVIHASTEALVSSAGRIFKKGIAAQGSRYGVEIDPAKIVFLGNCRLVHKADGNILTGSFLILDLGARTVSAKGSGLVARLDEGFRTSGDEEAGVSVNLDSGALVLSGTGWIDAFDRLKKAQQGS